MSTDQGGTDPCFRLPLTFDVGRLQADLAALDGLTWPPERPFIMNTPFVARTLTYHDGKWRGLGLRSQGGVWRRTDPGGPGLEGFADTDLLDRTPYMRQVLDSLECEKRSVRLLSLPGGAEVKEHTDPYHGFRYGQLRLHVPVRTHPDVRMLFGGRDYQWAAGELWYADFGRPHAVENLSPVERVHLVIDVLLSEPLLRLFPEEVLAQEERTGILRHLPEVPLSPGELRGYTCHFTLPAALIQGILETDDGSVPGELDAQVGPSGGQLVLAVAGTPVFGLVPVGGHRFALRGWTPERLLTFEFDGAGEVSSVVMLLRSGRRETTIRMAVRR